MNVNPNVVVTSNPSKDTFCFCSVCNVQFKTDIDYEMHAITSEHIILKFLTPKNHKQRLKNDHSLSIVNKTLITHNEQSQSVEVNIGKFYSEI